VTAARALAEPVDPRMLALLRGASLEIPARDTAAPAVCRALLAPGTAVHVHHGPGDSSQDVVAAGVRLARAGLTPVPHLAARALESFTRLNDCLARLAGEAGVTHVMVTAGELDRAVGPYESSLALIETGLLQKHGIRRVAIAGYPERHPRIAAPALEAARVAKLARLAAAGLAPVLLSQFCLEAAPIAAWGAATRAAGLAAPIRVGLAGPAPVATLASFAVRCGTGGSIRALARGQSSVARMLREAGPEPIIRALARAELPIEGLHFFAFGGVARTASWLAAAIGQ
jgi:methylenetetrahydrofolate reductase (NADPH)